jgi:hypothetical protein
METALRDRVRERLTPEQARDVPAREWRRRRRLIERR